VYVAVDVALATAAVYVISATWRRMAYGTLANVSRDLVWMSPLAYLFWFALASLPVAVAALFVPRRALLRLGTFWYVTIGVFSLFLPYTNIARWAALVFAVGVATVAARGLSAHPDSSLAALRRTTRTLFVAFVVAAGVSTVARVLRVRQAYAALGPAPAGAPNVILLILDTVRADALGVYGSDANATPNLDRLAARGTVFQQALSTASWTLPSHGTMFTGRYAGELSTSFLHPLDAEFPTLGEIFAKRNYVTVGITANHHYTSWESGLSRGFVEWRDYRRSFLQLLKSSSIGQMEMMFSVFEARTPRDVWDAIVANNLYVNPKPESDSKTANLVTDEFLSWHGERGDRPFFAFLNFYDVHNARDLPLDAVAAERGERPIWARYEEVLESVDREVGRLLDSLERRGALENTYVILTADHGELLGERNLQGHGQSLYYPLLHVPLIVTGPGVPAGTRVERMVSLRDIPATIADLAALGPTLPGHSLARLWRGDETAPVSPPLAEQERGINLDRSLPVMKGRMQTIFDDNWQYIVVGDKSEELYAYRRDPEAQFDLAETDSGRAVLPAMRALLEESLRTRTAAERRSAAR
jgi:arylsulfatase A-like enzyme